MKRILTLLAVVSIRRITSCPIFLASLPLRAKIMNYAYKDRYSRTTDAYIRRDYPQFRLKFGVEF